MNRKTSWKTKNSKTVYKNKWMELIEDKIVLEKDGTKVHEGIYAYVKKSKSVFIIAKNDNEEIYFIRQNRYPLGQILIELPAGSTEGKDTLFAAKKELYEEIGIKAQKWTLLGTFFPTPSSGNQECFVYLAEDLNEAEVNNDPNEAIEEVFKVTTDELQTFQSNNDIRDGETLAALNIFFNSKNAKKK